MAGRKKQPVKLIQMKGRANLTKEEIAKREKEEVKTAPPEGIVPSYLSAKQKRIFTEYADQLTALDIYSDLDREMLAAFVVATEEFAEYSKEIRRLKIRQDGEVNSENLSMRKRLALERDRSFKIAKQVASELGLTITSRCKLVIPQAEEEPKNKFEAFVR